MPQPDTLVNNKNRKQPIAKRIIKIGGLIFLLFATSMAIFLTLVPEVRSYVMFKITPAYARNAHFIKLTKDNQEVYLLGTIYKMKSIEKKLVLRSQLGRLKRHINRRARFTTKMPRAFLANKRH